MAYERNPQMQLYDLLKANDAGFSKTPPPLNISTSNCDKKLSIQHVSDAVILSTWYLGISGSVGDFDLYRANQAYLLDPDMREKINDLLHGWRHPMFRGSGLKTDGLDCAAD